MIPWQPLHSRRDFLKIAAAGTAGIVFFPGRSQGLSVLSGSAGWRTGLIINPSIANVKTICCFDEAMVVNKVAGDFARQNEGVDATLIAKNMDEIATKLTNISTASEAWKTIFRKPTDKQWNQVKAAIKVNCANTFNMPRVAIVGKVCAELIATGVLPANITIYDSLNNASDAGKYGDTLGNPISGLPSGIVVWTKTLDGPTVPVGSTTMQCSSAIAQPDTDPIIYNADILVNIGANAGVDTAGSEPNLCMNNHVGTLKFSTPTAPELIAMNQCEAVIGQGTTAVPCRQQLCIIDSLWATIGPAGADLRVPCRIVMGMLPPVMDYLVAKNIREPQRIMNTPPNVSLITSWLTAFGYTTNDVVSAWQEYSPSTSIRPGNRTLEPGTVITVSLGNASGARFTMPHKNLPVAIDVFTLNGQHVRHLTIPPRSDQSITVSLHESGSHSGAGRYTIRCRMGREEKIAIAESGF